MLVGTHKNVASVFVQCLNGKYRIVQAVKTFNLHKRTIYNAQHKYKKEFDKKIQYNSLFTSTALQKIVPFNLSDIGEGIKEVNIKEWFVKVGDRISQFDNICEVQSDKASVTITSRYDGVVNKLYYEIDDTALVGKPLVDIDVDDNESSSDEETDNLQKIETVSEEIKPKVQVLQTNISSGTSNHILAIPAVRKLAKDYNIDLRDVKPTGKDNRVLKEDILNHVQGFQAEPMKSFSPQTLQHKKHEQLTRIEPLKGFTKGMMKTMTASLKIPHFVYSDEVYLSKLVETRKSIKTIALESGYKISYMPFFIKAASKALSKYPILNASIDNNCENIIYKNYHNIGVAMDTPYGLIVPNIKDVENKSILDITKDLMRIQELGAKGALSNDDLTDGTFTLSNIGTIGGTYTKPVILPPEVSIGAIGRVQILPRFNNENQVVPEHVIQVSWAADHRVIDGVTMAKFSNLWKYFIENPNILMLNIK